MSEDRREIERLLHVAEVIASEPYATPEAAVIHLIKAVKLMHKAQQESSDE